MSAVTNEMVEYIPHLRRYAFSLTRRQDEADDLVQDCLERAVSRIAQFEPGTNLRAWLFKIMHSLFINDRRKVARRGTTVEIEDWQESAQCAPSQETNLEVRDFERAFSQLTEETRAVLKLVTMEGMKYEEAAEELSIPVGTVRSRISRARTHLRRFADDADIRAAGAPRARPAPDLSLGAMN